MKSITHREYLTRLAWLDQIDINRPDRADWYTMQLTSEVARKFAKNPSQIKPELFQMKFRPVTPEEVAEKERQAAELSDTQWFAAAGIPVPPEHFRDPESTA